MAWPNMNRHIALEMSGLVRPYGFLFSSSSVGCSVANANDAKVSMMRLTHSNCTALNGESVIDTAAVKTRITATMLTVNWNCMNFDMES